VRMSSLKGLGSIACLPRNYVRANLFRAGGTGIRRGVGTALASFEFLFRRVVEEVAAQAEVGTAKFFR
jgi:hypothetical protein